MPKWPRYAVDPCRDTHPAVTIYDPHVRVEVASELCQGHNRCYVLAPELFDVDDFGSAIVRGEGIVTPDLEQKAKLAVANCPEYAIRITDDITGDGGTS